MRVCASKAYVVRRRDGRPGEAGDVQRAARVCDARGLGSERGRRGAGEVGTAGGCVDRGPTLDRCRGGLDRPAETEFADLDCSSVSPAALYGYGRDDDDGAAY